MTMPSFVAIGTGSETAPTWGAGHVADDLGILPIETATETPNATTSASGSWTRHTLSGSRADTKATVDYRFATSGSEANAAVGATANHIWGSGIAVFRNVDMTSPIVMTVCGQFAATTSGFSPKFYCPVGGVLVVYIISFALDATSLSVSAAANSSLANVTIRVGAVADTCGTTTGNGGGIAIITGELAAAGDVGECTWTQTSSGCTVTVLVLRPNAEVACSGTVTIDNAPAPNASDVVTLFNLTHPADPPITGIDISGGAGGWSSFVRYTGDTYQAVYRAAAAAGASDDAVAA